MARYIGPRYGIRMSLVALYRSFGKEPGHVSFPFFIFLNAALIWRLVGGVKCHAGGGYIGWVGTFDVVGGGGGKNACLKASTFPSLSLTTFVCPPSFVISSGILVLLISLHVHRKLRGCKYPEISE